MKAWKDVIELTKISQTQSLLRVILGSQSCSINFINRIRECSRRFHILGVNHALRIVQTSHYGIEIGSNVQLGHGTYFVHPIGIVIGGNSKIGDRVKFMGSNTVGTAKDNGYPTIEDDVVVGVGARILGPITIGARSVVGANAVVLTDIPPDSVAVGIPAKVIETIEGVRQ